MELFDDEEILWSTSDKSVIVTTYRLRVTTKDDSRFIQSVLLKQIVFCSLEYKHYPWLVIVSALTFIAAFASLLESRLSGPYAGVCFFVTLLCGLIYMTTRRTWIHITTKGEPIPISASGKSLAFAVELIDAVEFAIVQLSKQSRAAIEPETEVTKEVDVPLIMRTAFFNPPTA